MTEWSLNLLLTGFDHPITRDLPAADWAIDLHDSYNIGRADNFFTGTIDQVGLYDYALSKFQWS